MQLCTVTQQTDDTTAERTFVGLVDGEEVVDLSGAYADAVALLVATVEDRSAVEAAVAGAPRIPVAECRFEPPIARPGKILCVGTNYADHAAESDTVRDVPPHPVLFVRFPESLVGHGAPIVRPAASHVFDYEGELAIVIGRTTSGVAEADALDAVAGYAPFMDGTIRDWQRHTSQFTPGKNFDRSGAWGPCITTADEIDDPAALSLTTTVSGEVLQSSTTDLLIHSIPKIVSYVSTFTTLQPGDVIATGTPGGVGYARDPQRLLVPGDTVRVEISGVGLLENTVTD